MSTQPAPITSLSTTWKPQGERVTTGTNTSFAAVVHGDGHPTTVLVRGEIDILTAPELRAALHECIARGCDELVIDLNGAPLIDASGLSVIIEARNQLGRHGGHLELRNPSPLVVRVLEATGLTNLLQ